MKREWPRSIALWTLALGAYAAIHGVVALGNWDVYAAGTRLYYAVSLAAGAIAAGAGVWMLCGRGMRGRAIWAAPAALGLLAANQMAGLLLSTIPCFTPG